MKFIKCVDYSSAALESAKVRFTYAVVEQQRCSNANQL